jgi:glycosyltransferase involved in cell wall biosynthesis
MKRLHTMPSSNRLIQTDGKQFALGGKRFRFRGVTYGTFRAREDGALFPEREQLKHDLSDLAEAGFTVLRTYTPPTDDLLDCAADWDLRVLYDAFYLDWRYLIGASRRQTEAIAAEARRVVRYESRRTRGDERVLALSLGNEIPADAVRWVGTKRITNVIEDLRSVVREEDPQRLVTYANYPTTEYLQLDCLDFLTFNVFLEDEHAFRRYLTHLQQLAGDRPLVLGETGMHASGDPRGEIRQAETVGWQLSTALERGVAGTCLFSWTDDWWVGDQPVEGWSFGLTRKDRSPRPALDVARDWNQRGIEHLRDEWPALSVVICAYNAAATLDECLRHTCALDYPNLEVIVVDDGSTDETPKIVNHHPQTRHLRIPHSGLSAARNEGFRSAGGEIVAYLDADAFPSPEWPYFMVLGFDGRRVGGVGGPNVPPPNESLGAQVVARAPGGPVQVLFSDDRAEHVPGCNMAFWKNVLTEVGGFDPVFTSAGDDVDLCWRVLDKDWEISYSPAALVWHRRRSGLSPYLRQQAGYGRSEALVEARHPDRFGPLRTACWRGRIYNTLSPPARRQRIYRGPLGLSSYQSIYQSGGHGLDIAHQAGVPVAALMLASAPFGLLSAALALPALAALAFIAGLTFIDMYRVNPPQGAGLRFRASVALHHVLQPLVRSWGRWINGHVATRDRPQEPLPGPVDRAGRGVLTFPDTQQRAELVGAAASALRRAGRRVQFASEWEDHDLKIASSRLVHGALVTSSHVHGVIQLRVRPKLQISGAALILAIALGLAPVSPALAGVTVALAAGDIAWGCWRAGPSTLRFLEREAK